MTDDQSLSLLPSRMLNQTVFFFATFLWSAVPLNIATISAQQDTAPQQATVDEELLTLRKQLKSPRETVFTFKKAMEREDFQTAYKCLDLGWMDPATAAAKQQTYAVKLRLVLQKYLTDFDLITLSENPDEGEQPYAVGGSTNLEGINLVRNSDQLWIFSKSSLELLDGEKYDALAIETEATNGSLTIPLWIQQRFDESWWGTTFLLKDYQWVCLAVLLVGGLLFGQLAKLLLDYLTLLWFRITSTDVDDQPRLKLWTPVVALLHIWIWYLGTQYIDLPSSVMGLVLPCLTFFMVVSAVWTAFRLIDVLQNYLLKKARLTASRYDDSLVPLVGSALKLVAIALGIILFVDVFKKDWTTLLGGFGVVGIAVAIAAKDMLGNIFGSITVLGDQPFEIGDWIIIDGKVEGTVEHVGIRSSRLRTFHNSQIIVPNSLLTTAIVDNMGRRKFRRFKTKLQLRYDTTSDQLEAFCAGVRQLIEIAPQVKTESAHVYVNDLGESSIDVLLYVFFECPDWAGELEQRHHLIRKILKLAEELKIGFAFPTRTLEMSPPQEAASSSNHDVASAQNPRKWGEMAAQLISKK